MRVRGTPVSRLCLPFLLLLLPATARGEVDFDTEIVPLLTKAGCNSGACHGAAAGRGGFHLSLLGANPAFDLEQIVHEFEGRRVNLVDPALSLVIQKPTEQIAHEGGTRFDYDGPQARLLARWIREGASRRGDRQLASLTIQPRTLLLESPGDSAHIRVTARFSDGTEQDVTGSVVYSVIDVDRLSVNPDGVVTVQHPGRHTVLLRYLDRVEVVTCVLPYSTSAGADASPPADSLIDREIDSQLQQLGIPPSPPADEATWYRRVWLDLTGRLPTPHETRRWLNDTRPDKRIHLVDQLLASEAAVTRWTWYWSQLFQISSRSLQSEGVQAFHHWVEQQVRAQTPVDELVRALLLTRGDSYQHGAANYLRIRGGAREQAEFVSESLLGARLRCANCHDHPFDRWTQDDYHGLAAIFAQLDRGAIVRESGRGSVTHPQTGEPALPRLPGVRHLNAEEQGARVLADWITDPRQRMLPRAIVNRLWKELMGRGLVEPVDDLRTSNPASHPPLLELLTDEFIASGYDSRQLLRSIVTSAAYARSSQTLPANAADEQFYSRTLARPLPAEIYADAVADVTGVPLELPSSAQRALELVDTDSTSASLERLGRCTGQESCAGSPAAEDLGRTLHLMNGSLLNARITASSGRLQQLLASGADDAAMLEEFYLRAFCRLPTPEEEQQWLSRLAPVEHNRRDVWEDLLWALLSSREFQFRL